jgi:hypothetical protein
VIEANGTAVGFVARREKEKVVAGGLNVEEFTALEAADTEDAAEDAVEDAVEGAPLLVPTATVRDALGVDVA